jgi:hypothetical protein
VDINLAPIVTTLGMYVIATVRKRADGTVAQVGGDG